MIQATGKVRPITKERRPLGIHVNDQGIYQPVMQPERDRKQAERIAVKNYAAQITLSNARD